MHPTVTTAAQVDRSALEAFLFRLYPPAKAEFLCLHGAWWHGGDENRWVLSVDGQIAGYCAVIPTRVLIEGDETPAIWWVDLVIAPEFRGRGLQSLFDTQIRETAMLKLGVPNALAAKIHRKHGWGVREDYQVLLLPLQPPQVKTVRMTPGWRGKLIRVAALVLSPFAFLLRRRFEGYFPQTARRVPTPSPDALAAVFARNQRDDLTTVHRDAAFIQWRYLDAPYRDELTFYLAGPDASPTHYLITRQILFKETPLTRILDLYGDSSDQAGMKDILQLAIKDAVQAGSSQVTVLNTLPEMRTLFHSLGFLIPAVSRFCWHTGSQAVMKMLNGDNYWTLADSDNDAPE